MSLVCACASMTDDSPLVCVGICGVFRRPGMLADCVYTVLEKCNIWHLTNLNLRIEGLKVCLVLWSCEY